MSTTPQNDATSSQARARGGIVLAGGPGRRLGRSKADVEFGGMTLVEHAVGLLAVRCRDVVVVTRAGVPLPPLAVPVLVDRPGPDAPLVGIATGLAALSTDDVLVLACDLPLAGPALDLLVAAPPGRATAASDGGRPQPLCARYPRAAALDACEELLAAGALPARGLATRLDALLVDAPQGTLLNVNDGEDLARARQILERGRSA